VILADIAKELLPPILIRPMQAISRRFSQSPVDVYIANGRRPWTFGYLEYKQQYLESTLDDQALMDRFGKGISLPDGYGIGLDERCIEYPWLLSQLDAAPRRLLDAGSALNHEFVLRQPRLRDATIHILTLAPEATCLWTLPASYIFSDLRDMPTREGYYDAVACISTLEHVGFDNSFFAHERPPEDERPFDFRLVMQELRRVLKPGGDLFLTVPFGEYRNVGWFQQFNSELLQDAIDSFGPCRVVMKRFYRYQRSGWQIADEAAVRDSQFVSWNDPRPGAAKPPRDDSPTSDLAAAARAVACVKLVKA
jgi:SAM-dependent methyltransferase